MPFHVECLHVGLHFVDIIVKRKSFVTQERASVLALGWDRSPFEDVDCDGLGVIDLGTVLPLDFPLGLRSFPLTFLSPGRLILFRLPWMVVATHHLQHTQVDYSHSAFLAFGFTGRLHWEV